MTDVACIRACARAGVVALQSTLGSLALVLTLSLSLTHLPAHAEDFPEPQNDPALLDKVLTRAFAVRLKLTDVPNEFKGPFDAKLMVLQGDWWMLRFSSETQALPQLLFHVCRPRTGGTWRIDDAVFLPPGESAAEFYRNNLISHVSMDADVIICMPAGMAMQSPMGSHDVTSPTRVLIQMGVIARYFIEFRSDPRRGSDFLRTAATQWLAELEARSADKEPRWISLALLAMEDSFPIELIERASLDATTRNALRRLFSATLILRRRISALDETQGALVRRDEKILARLGAP